MIKFSTAGESHGECLVGILEGLPSNIYIDINHINWNMRKRQRGYGRGKRMSLENDLIKIVSGLDKRGYTTGNPISIILENKAIDIDLDEVKRPRPGHADLSGLLKYNKLGARSVIERASARETAMRVAIGSILEIFLKELGIEILSHVIEIGSIKAENDHYKKDIFDYKDCINNSEMNVSCKNKELEMINEIRKYGKNKDTIGGKIQTVIRGVPVGLGDYIAWDRKLDGNISRAVMSIPAIKGIEFGKGFKSSSISGSDYHDEIYYDNLKFKRLSNNAGGIEGGMSNGEDIIFNTIMKPIPTLRKPLISVNIDSKEKEEAIFERSDISAVPSASIVVSSMAIFVIAQEILIKFGGDSLEEVLTNYKNYLSMIESR